jgi:predicted nucleotidyltransferase component of viral defense system
MIFHQSPEFANALEAAAGYFKLRPVFIEKDYWVTHVLKNLSQSSHRDEVIFKGGTSLSKAYNYIERFSEDIDLAIVKMDGMTGNQITNKIKAVEKSVSAGLQYFQHRDEEKKGRNRRTFYHYHKALDATDFGQVKDHIQVEINSFTNPVPFAEVRIESYVAQFLKNSGFESTIPQFHLEPFSVKVLKVERTFFEKLFSLIRLSNEGTNKLKEKIRHFYDLHKLLDQKDLKGMILSKQNFKLIDLVKADDGSNGIFKGNWLNEPLLASPLFAELETIWKEVEPTYRNDLAPLVWTELPASEEIIKSLRSIKEYVSEYDQAKITKE